MSGGAMQQVPADHPLMVAWTTYKATEEYANTLYWTMVYMAPPPPSKLDPAANRPTPEDVRKRTTEGSLWAAFAAGFKAGNAHAADLHEQISPASDDERHHKTPGAGAMGAVIEYRDTIRRSVQL